MYQTKSFNNGATNAVEAAAMEAAVADGLITANGLYANDDKAKKAGLRRGKWTTEEELYANRLIYEFKLGLLPLTDGTTLRTFLSKLLNCDPMRISKKFVGQNCIGKQVFRRRQQDLEKLTPEQIETSRRELAELERRFLERVAQTNRAKTSGNGTTGGKEPRMDYEDESGNAVLPPWMAPPPPTATADPSGSSSAGKALTTLSGSYPAYDSSISSMRHLQQAAQDFHSAFPVYHQQQLPRYNGSNSGSRTLGSQPGSHLLFHDGSNRAGRSDDASLPRVTSLDVLNTIAQFNSPSGSVDNLTHLANGSAVALKQQQLAYQQQQQEQGRLAQGYSTAVDPTPDVFPGLVERAHSSTLTLGDSVGWPSFSNLNSFGGGGSMDDLLAAGGLYNMHSSSSDAVAAPPLSAGGGGSGQKYQAKLSSLSVEDGSAVGYPFEDGGSSGAAPALTPKVEGSSPPGMPLRPGGDGQVRVKAPIVDVAGMSAMAHMYQPPGRSGPSGAVGTVGAPVMRSSSGDGAPGPPLVRSDSLRSNGSALGLTKNGSVEDFWMLVNMGDLPRPEQDVLSQTVWSPLERGNSGGSVGLPTTASAASATGGAPSGGPSWSGAPEQSLALGQQQQSLLYASAQSQSRNAEGGAAVEAEQVQVGKTNRSEEGGGGDDDHASKRSKL